MKPAPFAYARARSLDELKTLFWQDPARYLVKLIAYHLLTEPRIHVAARRGYEIVGRRHPLPRPTEEAELRGERPAGFARRLSNGQDVVSMFKTDPQMSEYEYYQLAKAEREKREAEENGDGYLAQVEAEEASSRK